MDGIPVTGLGWNEGWLGGNALYVGTSAAIQCYHFFSNMRVCGLVWWAWKMGSGKCECLSWHCGMALECDWVQMEGRGMTLSGRSKSWTTTALNWDVRS